MAWMLLRKPKKGASELMMEERGFTLIELLIVVAIIGIISAIAIPNLLNALNRGRQKRCMADMRSIGEAIEAYSVDYQFYPRGVGTVVDLEAYLTPTYLHELPTHDAWGSEFFFVSDSAGATYTIVSYGRDSTAEGSTWSPGPTSSFDNDIVFSQGVFYRWPEGVQR